MKALLTQSEKEILFKEFEESGKTYAQFSAEKGLNLKTFSKWIYEWHRQNKEICSNQNNSNFNAKRNQSIYLIFDKLKESL